VRVISDTIAFKLGQLYVCTSDGLWDAPTADPPNKRLKDEEVLERNGKVRSDRGRVRKSGGVRAMDKKEALLGFSVGF